KAALPIGPSTSMGVLGRIGKDNFTRARRLHITAEAFVALRAHRLAHRQIALDTVQIEHRDWDRISNRGVIAEIDERMNGWKVAVLSEPPQQCLRRASILSRLEAHRSKGCPPGADLRKSSFGHRRDPVGGLC